MCAHYMCIIEKKSQSQVLVSEVFFFFLLALVTFIIKVDIPSNPGLEVSISLLAGILTFVLFYLTGSPLFHSFLPELLLHRSVSSVKKYIAQSHFSGSSKYSWRDKACALKILQL